MRETWHNTFPKTTYTKRNSVNNKNNYSYHTKLPFFSARFTLRKCLFVCLAIAYQRTWTSILYYKTRYEKPVFILVCHSDKKNETQRNVSYEPDVNNNLKPTGKSWYFFCLFDAGNKRTYKFDRPINLLQAYCS